MFNKNKIALYIISFLSLFMLLFIIYGDNGYLEMQHLIKEKQKLLQKKKNVCQTNISFYSKINRLKQDPVFIENIARREHGLVMPDEMILQFK